MSKNPPRSFTDGSFQCVCTSSPPFSSFFLKKFIFLAESQSTQSKYFYFNESSLFLAAKSSDYNSLEVDWRATVMFIEETLDSDLAGCFLLFFPWSKQSKDLKKKEKKKRQWLFVKELLSILVTINCSSLASPHQVHVSAKCQDFVKRSDSSCFCFTHLHDKFTLEH